MPSMSISGLAGAAVFELGVDVTFHNMPQQASARWQQEV